MTLSRQKQCALSPIPLTQFLRLLMKVHFLSPPQSKKVYSTVYSIINPCPIFKFLISMHSFCFMRRQNFDGSSKAPTYCAPYSNCSQFSQCIPLLQTQGFAHSFSDYGRFSSIQTLQVVQHQLTCYLLYQSLSGLAKINRAFIFLLWYIYLWHSLCMNCLYIIYIHRML